MLVLEDDAVLNSARPFAALLEECLEKVKDCDMVLLGAHSEEASMRTAYFPRTVTVGIVSARHNAFVPGVRSALTRPSLMTTGQFY